MIRGVPHAGSVRALGPTLAIAGMMLALAGCSGALSWAGAGKLIGAIVSGSLEADVLRIATSWPRSEQVRLECEFLDWIARDQPQSRTWSDRTGMDRPWMRVNGSIACATDFNRRMCCSVVLSASMPVWPGPGSSRLSMGRKLRPGAVARRSVIVLAGGGAERPSRLAFDDPRTDPLTLAWSTGQLSKLGWSEGYAKLVSLFGHASHKPGWRSGSALAAYRRGEAEATLWAIAPEGASKTGDADSTGVSWNEGVAICRESLHPALARTFLRFLAETRDVRAGYSIRWVVIQTPAA